MNPQLPNQDELAGVDTETTGLELLQTRRPYMVTTWSTAEPTDANKRFEGTGLTKNGQNRLTKLIESIDNGHLVGTPANYRLDLDPKTLWPNPERDFYRWIKKKLNGKSLIFFNGPYDLMALLTVGVVIEFERPNFSTEEIARIVPNELLLPEKRVVVRAKEMHECQFLAHLYDNKGPKDLKTCGIHYLKMSDKDETELTTAVRLAKSARRKMPENLQPVLPHSPKSKPADPDNPNPNDRKAKDTVDSKACFWLPNYLHKVWRESDESTREELRYKPFDHWEDIDEVYGSLDAYRTVALFYFFTGLINKKFKGPELDQAYENYNKQRDLLPEFSKMQACGMPLKTTTLSKLTKQYKNKSQELVAENNKLITTVLGKPSLSTSPKDLAQFLHDKLGLPVTNKTAKSKQPSTDRDTLLGHYKAITEGRYKLTKKNELRAKKFIRRQIGWVADEDDMPDDNLGAKSYLTASNYLRSYHNLAVIDSEAPQPNPFPRPLHRIPKSLKEGSLRIYPNYNQTGTDWTRASSQNPNGQNISNKGKLSLRRVFGPGHGEVWLAIDYSQLEIRLFAIAAQAEVMLEALNNNKDVHQITACELFQTHPDNITSNQRRLAKNINFGYIYGMGEAKLIKMTGDPEALKLYNERFPDVASFMAHTSAQVKRHGWVETLYGYRLNVFPDPPHKGPNGIVQGSAGDLVKSAMRILCRPTPDLLNPDKPHRPSINWTTVRMFGNVHDELLFSVKVPEPEDPTNPSMRLRKIASRICRDMESAAPDLPGANTPVDCSLITDNWSEKHDINQHLLAPSLLATV